MSQQGTETTGKIAGWFSNRASGTLGATLFPLIALSALVVLTWPILQEMARRWLHFEQTYSHGLLVFAVSLGLIARYLIRIRPVLSPSLPWLGGFLGLLLIYLLGHALLIQAFQQLVVLPLFWSVMAVFWGWRQARYFIIPLALVFFAIPIWETLRLPLQELTAGVNHLALGLIGIDFIIDGLFVQLPGIGVFEIARGCSGLNYLLVSLTLGLLIGEQNLCGLRDRVLLLMMAGALSLFANWIRVLVIIYVGFKTEMESALIDDHANFGWAVFAVAMLPLFWFGFRLTQGRLPQKLGERSAAIRRGILPLLLALLATGISIGLMAPPSIADRTSSASLSMEPLTDGQWVPLFQKKLADWQPELRNADTQWVRTFGQAGDGDKTQRVLIALYSYHYQRAGAELVQYGNRLYAQEKFRVAETWQIESESAKMKAFTLTNRANSDRLHLARAYFVNGRWHASPEQVKKAQLASLFGGQDHAALLVLGLDCDDCDPAVVLNDLTREITPEADRALNAYYAEP